MNTINKELKKQRILHYFLEAALQQAQDGGIDSLTIRNVSALAGYNSATLYNYFRNLEELTAFTVLHVLSAFWQDAAQQMEQQPDPLLRYCLLWLVQGQHAYRNPEIFHYLFRLRDHQKIFSTLDRYYELFPQELEALPEWMKTLVLETDFQVKNRMYIEPCLNSGDLNETQAQELVEIGHLLFNGILFQVLHDRENQLSCKYCTEQFLRYFIELAKPRILKDPDRLDQLWDCSEKLS